jgi:murein DD-endopeptidase MepM/ murein hydrolase activator NlpD
VVGEVGSRNIDWSAGTTAEAYSRDIQTSDDPDEANSMGWDCRVHVEYEGQAAVDWYIPVATPVHATLDGRATMYVVSFPNAFDYYDASREPYIGNPDRARAAISPFPGPGGGKGVFIEVTNDAFATEYAHLDLESTLSLVPAGAYLDGFSVDYDYETAFGTMRAFDDYTAIASWDVQAGAVIGYSGDSGYSEAPHLHYTVRRAGTSDLLCPTTEAGFEDGGWLFR